MAQKPKRSSFRGKVASNAIETSKSGASYGYLNLPKGISVFNPDPDGRYVLDFLPYEVTNQRHPDRNSENQVALPGTLWWRRPFKVHRGIGGGDGDTVVCLGSIGKKCPICEQRAKLVKEGAGKEEIKALNASKRMLYLVFVLESKEKTNKDEIHIFDISEYNFQDLLTEELKEDESNEIFPDLQEGKSVKVRFEGNTIGNSKPFAVANRIDFIDRDEQYDESLLKDIPNLDEVLNIMSYDELQAKFLEIEEEEDSGKLEEEEEEETPTHKPIRKPVVSKEEEEEEEEEEKPTRKPTRKPVKEEEEEEEEKPSRKPLKPTSGGKCPHGYKFGVDTDKYKQCDTCDVWTDCIAKKENS